MQRTPEQITKDITKVAKALSKTEPRPVRDIVAKTGLDRSIVNFSLDRLHVIRHGDTRSAEYTLEKEGIKPPLKRNLKRGKRK